MELLSPWLIWFLIGLALILSEFAIPGVILVFFGIGAWFAALFAGLGLIDSLGGQIAVFGIVSVVTLFTLRKFFKNWFVGVVSDTSPEGSENLDEYLGKSATALDDIAAGARGKVEFKGAQWNAVATTALVKGERATITALEGLTLTVDKS